MAAAKKALDNYLVWELCKQENIQERVMEGSADGGELKEFVEKVRNEYHEEDYDRNEKMNKLRELDGNPDYRSRIFEDCSWTKETVKVEDLGTTLPRAGGLPPEVISGSLQDVVDFVKEADPEEYQSVKYINKLKGYPEVLDKFLPWVLTPGNRPGKKERMNKVHGQKDWEIEDTRGMINDGNHRTIAKILANDLEEIKCYVGHRQNRE